MDRLVIVKFHINIANRWLFMIRRRITATILYSSSYFDMFRGAVFSGHGIYIYRSFSLSGIAVVSMVNLFTVSD